MSSIEVQLVCDPAHGLQVQPPFIILFHADDRVTWTCPNLPLGASVEVAFNRAPYGPFSSVEADGDTQVGTGNVAPAPGDLYVYQATVTDGETWWEGTGSVFNLSPSQPPIYPIGCGDPSSGPPCNPH